jgi:cation diffusion facilitator CzcD-associated flavoprotein CzcO
VHLVDTDGQGVEAIDETGVVVNGQHYDLDCLILASGFEVGTSYARRCGYETTGRDGLTLSEKWDDGMRSLHGMHVRGFPNLFIAPLAQAANLISNVTHNMSEGGITVAAVVAHALDNGITEVEPSESAEEAWVDLISQGTMRLIADPDCTPGYYNNEGKPLDTKHALFAGGYPMGPVAFFTYIKQWRESGSFDGLEFR